MNNEVAPVGNDSQWKWSLTHEWLKRVQVVRFKHGKALRSNSEWEFDGTFLDGGRRPLEATATDMLYRPKRLWAASPQKGIVDGGQTPIVLLWLIDFW